MTWTGSIQSLESGRVRQVSLNSSGTGLTYADVIDLWQGDADFRIFFIGLLNDAPFAAYFWETPPVTRANVSRPFEFVQVDAPSLARLSANARAFDEHFRSAPPGAAVISFRNLGGDALLVAPTPRDSAAGYAHIAAFTKTANPSQQQSFWQAVGRAMTENLSDRPLWLSTSGLGVLWLHVRLDSWPKYYTFAPYRTFE